MSATCSREAGQPTAGESLSSAARARHRGQTATVERAAIKSPALALVGSNSRLSRQGCRPFVVSSVSGDCHFDDCPFSLSARRPGREKQRVDHVPRCRPDEARCNAPATATNFANRQQFRARNEPAVRIRRPPAVDRPRAALVARSLLCASAAVGCARACLRVFVAGWIRESKRCRVLVFVVGSVVGSGRRRESTVVRHRLRYESRLGQRIRPAPIDERPPSNRARTTSSDGAMSSECASVSLSGWSSFPSAISPVHSVFVSVRNGGGSTEPLIGLVFIRWIVALFAFSDGQGADGDAAIFARRPPKTPAAPIDFRCRDVECRPRTKRTRTRRVRSSSLSTTRAPPLGLPPQMVKSDGGMSDRRAASSRDHRPPRRAHARPPHAHRSSSSTPHSPSRRRDDRRCPPASGPHASASEPSSAFDVNSFLHKTLSNFRLDQTELAAPSADGIDAGKKTAKRQATKLSRQSSTSDAAPLLAPNSIPTIAAVDQDGSLRPPSVKHTMTPSLSKGSLISLASSCRPLCRICHLQNDTPSDPLISPCRCSGTMQFVHTSCLVHWLEISTKKMCPSPRCELCGYFYKTRHCLNLQRVHLPHLDSRDKVLHTVFLLVFAVMIGCAVLSILYLQGEPQSVRSYRGTSTLTTEDLIVIICSVLFFCAFFVAVFTQYRAEASVCRVAFRCLLINRNWRIRNYDRRDDPDLVWVRPAPPDKSYTDNIV